MHTGINSLINMVYNKATGTVVILDNRTTGMTGHQDHAATGKTLAGEATHEIDIAGVCKAIGVSHVFEVNSFDVTALEETLKRETSREEISVIIAKAPCALLSKEPVKAQYTVKWDLCKKCGSCLKPGCPAITKTADGTVQINDTMCNGCGLCETQCKFGAIVKVEL